jgi:5'(3')-deoxyribonucleotidase
MDVDQGKHGLIDHKASDRICLLDMDGTIADYAGQMERDLARLADPSEPQYKLNWNDRLPDHVWNRVEMIKNSKDWWLNLPKLEDGFDLVRAATNIGFEIHVLTKGPRNTKTAWTQKVEWCAEHLPENTNVTITQDKSLVYGRILIDDYPGYVEGWLKNRPRGLAVMPLRPWNKDFRHSNVIHYDQKAYANQYGSLNQVYHKMQEQFER